MSFTCYGFQCKHVFTIVGEIPCKSCNHVENNCMKVYNPTKVTSNPIMISLDVGFYLYKSHDSTPHDLEARILKHGSSL